MLTMPQIFPNMSPGFRVLVLLVFSVFVANAQRTFMKTCECEYVTNGKCAYTLLLPIGESAASATCSDTSGGSSPNTSDPDLSGIQDQVTAIRDNLTTLADWSSTQARLLAQLQGFVLAIQNGDVTSDIQVDETTRPNPSETESLQAQLEDLNNSFSQFQGHVLNNLDSVRSSVELMQARVSDLEQSTRMEIQSLQQRLRELKSSSCTRRGLLVSGPLATITDDKITASSSFDEAHGPLKSRINNTESPGAWCPKEPNQDYEWIQFTFDATRWVYGTVLKGRHDFGQWATSYRVEYYKESPLGGESGENPTGGEPQIAEESWHRVNDVMGDVKIFPGNTDQTSAQTNLFWEVVETSAIRIIPLAGHRGFNKCLRADVIGCLDDVL